MKTIQKKLIFCILFMGAVFSKGQTTNIKPLSIGDQIPDLTISNIYQGSKPAKKMSDLYKGGLLIINFWATFCSPCLREMTQLNAWVKKYSGKFTVLSSTREEAKKIDILLYRESGLKFENLTVISDDKILHKYFPHRGLPHNVWINKEGKVINITYSDAVSEENIQTALSGKKLDVELKEDDMNFSAREFYIPKKEEYIFRSMFLGHNPKLRSESLMPTDEKYKYQGAFLINLTPLSIYWAAYSRDLKSGIIPKRALYVVRNMDSTKLGMNKNYKQLGYKTELAWRRDYYRTYELYFNKRVSLDTIYRYMKEDLERNFGIPCKIEELERPCLVMRATQKAKALPASKSDTTFIDHYPSKMIFRNVSADQIVAEFNENFRSLKPMINETGMKQKIDLDLLGEDPKKVLSTPKIVAKLKELGFTFTEEIRKVKVLIFGEK